MGGFSLESSGLPGSRRSQSRLSSINDGELVASEGGSNDGSDVCFESGVGEEETMSSASGTLRKESSRRNKRKVGDFMPRVHDAVKRSRGSPFSDTNGLIIPALDLGKEEVTKLDWKMARTTKKLKNAMDLDFRNEMTGYLYFISLPSERSVANEFLSFDEVGEDGISRPYRCTWIPHFLKAHVCDLILPRIVDLTSSWSVI